MLCLCMAIMPRGSLTYAFILPASVKVCSLSLLYKSAERQRIVQSTRSGNGCTREGFSRQASVGVHPTGGGSAAVDQQAWQSVRSIRVKSLWGCQKDWDPNHRSE